MHEGVMGDLPAFAKFDRLYVAGGDEKEHKSPADTK
jgi:hypothetical protein